MHLTARTGDVVVLDAAASRQFIQPITFRVIRTHDADTDDDWMWLDGYQLDEAGHAVERRSVFVQRAGLRQARL